MPRLFVLIWLRSRMWWHGLRSRASAADNAVAVILAVIAAVLSVALAFALGWVSHIGLRDGNQDALRVSMLVIFWVFGFLAVAMPVFFGFGRPQVPLSRLVVFPFCHGSLYRLSLAASFASGFNLFCYPILVAVSFVDIIVDGAPPIYW